MDKILVDALGLYFNDSLKKSLKYHDAFQTPVYIEGKDVIFFRNNNNIHELGNILRISPKLGNQLKSALVSLIKAYYQDLEYVNLEFNDHGFGIILIREQYIPKLEKQNIDTYANIIRHLGSVEEINQFCRSATEINKVCRSRELWRKLIKSVCAFKYKHEYNYEKLYKEYITYKSYDIEELSMYPYVKHLSEFEKMWYFINFLFEEGIIKPDAVIYETYMEPMIYMGDKELFNQVVGYLKSEVLDAEEFEFEIMREDYRLHTGVGDKIYIRLLYNMIDFTKGLIYKNENIGYNIASIKLFDIFYLIDDKNPLIKELTHNEEFKKVIKYVIDNADNINPDIQNIVPVIKRALKID